MGDQMKDVWTQWTVEWEFLTKVCGSVPADPALVSKWLESRQPTVRPAGSRSMQEINEEVLASLERGALDEEDEEASLLTFQRTDGTLVVRAGTIRAHLKDCARQLSSFFVGRVKGERTFAVKVINCLYLDESQYWVPLLRDGKPLAESDGFFDKAVHVMTRQGARSALKRIEYVDRPSLRFKLKTLGTVIREDDLHVLFQYGGTHGYGGERGDGEGRYTYTLTKESQ